MSRTARGAVAAGIAGVVLLASACAADVPQPTPEAVPSEAPPVLDEVRVERILADVEESLLRADAELDAELLGPRVESPAVEMRAAEYRLAEASGGERIPTPLTADRQIEVVGATDEWPRDVFVVTHVPEGSNLPLLLALRQDEPRGPYALWTWSRLLPGSNTPTTATAMRGSSQLAADAEGLLLTPGEALESYVDLLGDSGAEHADLFGEDAFSEEYQASLEAIENAVDGAGEVSRADSVDTDHLAALATEDGGALVVGVLESRLTISRTVEGSTVEAGGAIAELLDDPVIEGVVHADYAVTLALVIPPEGSDEVIEVIAAEQILLDVQTEELEDDAGE